MIGLENPTPTKADITHNRNEILSPMPSSEAMGALRDVLKAKMARKKQHKAEKSKSKLVISNKTAGFFQERQSR